VSAAEAIADLVSLVRAERRLDASSERDALSSVLTRLELAPGDAGWADGRDVVGEAFEQLVPRLRRRRLGQFFTPLWIARPMAEWLVQDSPYLILDPGIGSGSLMIGVAQACNSRGREALLLGLDVDPLALEMARITRHVRRIDSLELRQGDFLVDRIKDRPQAIVCNPPYTRTQDIPPKLKARIHDGFTRRLGLRVNRLASLHVLFLLRALEIADDNARIAFLTPAHWLDTNYARPIKALLLEQAHVESVISFPVEHCVFDHVVTTAAITLIHKGAPGDAPTRVLELPSMDAAEEGLLAAVQGHLPAREVVLDSGYKWSRPVPTASAVGTRLGDVANVGRGIATGCNAFFVLSEARRIELGISTDFLTPCIASPRYFSGRILTDADLDAMDDEFPRWLLKMSRAPRSGPMARYLYMGRTDFAVRDRTLVRHRVEAGRKWFEVEPNVRAPILFRYLNKSRPRFVRNAAEAAPLNNWLVIRPRPGVDPDVLFGLLEEAVTSSTDLESGSRHYGGGLWKSEPRELKNLLLPARAQTFVSGG
jgi:adenine-specific DNA-methyltransferase